MSKSKRGYAWSLQGSKASRRRKRQLQRSSRYYVVAVGRRNGIFDNWDDAHEQVYRYSGAVHKSFATLEEAFIYMYDKRVTPPAKREMFPCMRDTPRPSPVYEEAYLMYWTLQDRLQEQQESFNG